MKRKFTLIELLTVVVIFGILTAIVTLNIKDTKSEAYISSIHSNVNSIQVATDTYRQKNKGSFPTKESPTANQPQPIDFDKIFPDTLRTLPQTESIQYWIDHTGLVWATSLTLPNGLRYEGDGYVWDEVKGATEYSIYELKEEEQIQVLGKVIKIRSPYKSLGTTKNTFFKIDASVPILVSATDKYNLETPPSAILVDTLADSEIYKDAMPDAIDTTLNENQKPVAVIEVSPEDSITTTTNLDWFNSSYDPDGDTIINVEWFNKKALYSEEGTHEVGLRVQDSKGAWSDWTTKVINVKNNLLPPTAVIGMNVTKDIKTTTRMVWNHAASSDPNGLTITNAEWQNALEYYPKGLHTVRLRVQNSKGVWSEWVEKQFAVDYPNVAPTPVITITPSTNITTETAVTLSASKSYDLNGDNIINYEWSNARKYYPAGSNTVSLRVQDEKGLWSQWTNLTFTVLKPNTKPIAVISISEANKVFNITSKGSYDNDGDTIVDEYWVNKQNYYPVGKYIVYLKVKDSRGTWSDWSCKEIKITGADKPSQITNCSVQ